MVDLFKPNGCKNGEDDTLTLSSEAELWLSARKPGKGRRIWTEVTVNTPPFRNRELQMTESRQVMTLLKT